MSEPVALEFTGERYTPEIGGDIACEHLHRYALCLEAAAGKRVLDIASGEGYGSRMLAETAEHVTGVDVAPDAVAHARARYGDRDNLDFLEGSAAKIPLADKSVDLVVSFETLEHLTEHEDMLAEIDRVLTDEGRLIISTPDRYVYSEKTGYQNPYHVRELNTEEFVAYLKTRFPRCAFFRQRMVGASYVWPFEPGAEQTVTSWASVEDGVTNGPVELDDALYNIASCAKGGAAPAPLTASLYQHVASDAWKQMLGYMGEAGRLGGEVERLQKRIKELESALLSSSRHAGAGPSGLSAPGETEDILDALLKQGVTMTLSSPRLNLTYLAPAQAAKHVTVNETFRRLDALVQIRVLARDATTQPVSPSEGDCYALGASPQGEAWSGYAAGNLAVYADGAWAAITPGEGWIAFDADQDEVCIFDGASWVPLGPEHLRLGSAAGYDVGVGGETVPLQSGPALIGGEWVFGTGPVVLSEPGYGLRHGQSEWRISLSQASGAFYLHDATTGRFPLFVHSGAPDESLKVESDGALAARNNQITTPGGDLRLRTTSRADLLGQVAPTGAMALVTDGPNGPAPAFSDGAGWRWFDGQAV